jgi:AcrR family transcriptional regulator
MIPDAAPRRGPGRPRGAIPGRTRDVALDVASRLFADRGYRGTSLGDIAVQAGLSNAGLLHHFASKQDLLIEVLRRRDESDRTALANDSPPDADIWQTLEQLVTLAEMNSGRAGLVRLYTTVSAEAISHDHPAHSWLAEHLAQATSRLYQAFEDGKLRGVVRPEAPSASLARCCVAVLDGLQIQWLTGLGSAPPVGSAGPSATVPDGSSAPSQTAEMMGDVRVFVDLVRARWRLPG